MNVSRRTLLKMALGMPASAWLLNYRAIAAPHAGQLKITKIKTMGLDNLGDGCLIRIETDAGIVGYGEAGLPSAAARTRVDMMASCDPWSPTGTGAVCRMPWRIAHLPKSLPKTSPDTAT